MHSLMSGDISILNINLARYFKVFSLTSTVETVALETLAAVTLIFCFRIYAKCFFVTLMAHSTIVGVFMLIFEKRQQKFHELFDWLANSAHYRTPAE